MAPAHAYPAGAPGGPALPAAAITCVRGLPVVPNFDPAKGRHLGFLGDQARSLADGRQLAHGSGCGCGCGAP